MAQQLDSLERLVDAALVRIADEDGNTLGTGFVASDGGLVLTCDHVIGTRERVILHFADSSSRLVATNRGIGRFPAVDVALFDGGHASQLSPLPLVHDDEPPKRFWTKGFQFQRRGLTSAVPVRGDITGQSNIAYAGSDREYRLTVLVLNQGDLDEGLSGAPLLDPSSGAVCGIVVAHLPTSQDIRGFAVALSSAARLEPRLEWLLKLSDKECPRFGPHVNALGALQLCRESVRGVIERLQSERLYLPEFYCGRTQLADAVQRFARSTNRIMPIFGPAGVGKTTFLAHHASDLSEKAPALLLRGLDIAANHESITMLIDGAIVAAREDDWRESPHATQLASAVESDDELWLLLDGLNEHRATTRHLVDVWVPRTIEWLRSRRVRLLFTCRDELWHLIAERFPSSLVFQRDEKKTPRAEIGLRNSAIGMRLAEFAPSEAQDAIRAYALGGLVGEGLATLPLALRLMWELMGEGAANSEVLPASTPGIGTIIERLVTQICQRVSVACDVRSPRRVRDLVDAIAGALWRARGVEVTLEVLPPAFASAGPWLDALVDEHLLLAMPRGYRFAFDEISEYLQSAYLDLSASAGLHTVFETVTDPRSWGIVSHAYGRLATSESVSGLQTAVAHLNRWLTTESRKSDISLGFAVARRLSESGAHQDVIVEIITASRVADRDVTLWLLLEDADHLALDVKGLLHLAHILLPGEDSYPWRSKDWMDPFRRHTQEVFESTYSVSGLIGKALKRDASFTVATLFDWVSDSTNLEGDREATIHDFACACLLYAASSQLDLVCEGAAERIVQTDMASLLVAVAATSWMGVRQHLQKWIERPDRQRAAAETLTLACSSPETDIDRRDVVVMLERLVEVAVDPDIRYAVGSVLAGEPQLRERMWPLLFDGYVKGANVSAYTMTRYLSSHLTELAPVFSDRLQATNDADWQTGGQATAIVNAFGSHAREATSLRFTRELLGRSLSLQSAYPIARAVEQILYKADIADVEESGLLDICSALIEVSLEDAPVQCLLYIAYPTHGSDFPASSALRHICERFVDSNRFRLVCRQAGYASRTRGDEAFAWLEPYRGRLDQAHWDQLVIESIGQIRKATLGDSAERFWRSLSPENLTSIATAFLQARTAGLEPFKAAHEVLVE